jgi:hypothetical protein
MEPNPRDVIQMAEQFRAALLARDAEVLGRVARAYSDIARSLQHQIDALLLTIERDAPTPGQVAKMSRFLGLMDDVEAQLGKFGGWAEIEMNSAARAAIAQSVQDARQLVILSAGGNPAIIAGFNHLPVNTIESLLGFLQPNSALFTRLQMLAPATADIVRSKLIEGVGLGYGPVKLASRITDALGLGLTDALRMTRTVQLYSYREAARATFVANSDVVEGWYWYAELDGETCASCWAEHGTFHDNDEVLDDHYNGRCAMIPAVIGQDNPVDQSGEDAFGQLSPDKQQEILGPGKYDAWQAGKFEFSALSSQHEDEIYGTMRGEATLADLVGGE